MISSKTRILNFLKEIISWEQGTLGMHLALATQEYKQLDFISDRDLADVLEAYVRSQEIPPLEEEYETDY